MKPVAYTGPEKWIFVSYSHANKQFVFSFIARMQKLGFRIWYDGGLEPGDDWPEVLAKKLPDCGCVIAMVTKGITTSRWCPRELLMADDFGKKIVPIFWEDVELPSKLQLLLTGDHKEYLTEFEGDLEEFYSYLAGLKILAPYRDTAAPEVPEEEETVAQPLTDPWELPPSADPADFLCSGQTLTGYCGKGGHVVVPAGITAIAANAFSNKTAIRAIRLPEGVCTIGAGAFSGCTGLEAVALPESLQRLGQSAFLNCTALKEAALPSQLRVLPWHAFHGCRALEKVALPGALTQIGSQCFGDCCALTQITLPEGLLRLDRDAFSGCFSLAYVEGPALPNPEQYFANAFYKNLNDE